MSGFKTPSTTTPQTGTYGITSIEVAELRSKLAAALESRETVVEENKRLLDRVRILEAQVMPSAPGVVTVVKLVTPSCAEFHATEREAAERLQEENEALVAQLRNATESASALEKQVASVSQLVKRAEAEQARALADCREQLSRQHKSEILQLQEQMSMMEKKFGAERQAALAERNGLAAELAALKSEFTELEGRLHQAQQAQAATSSDDVVAQLRKQVAKLTEENSRMAGDSKQKLTHLSMPASVFGDHSHSARTPKPISSRAPTKSPKGNPKVPPISAQSLQAPGTQ